MSAALKYISCPVSQLDLLEPIGVQTQVDSFNPSYTKLIRTHTLYQGGGGGSHLDPLLSHQHLIVQTSNLARY